MDQENVVHLFTQWIYCTKNNDLMKFNGKCMELGKIMLSEITQTQKEKDVYTHLYVSFQVKNRHTTIHDPEKLGRISLRRGNRIDFIG